MRSRVLFGRERRQFAHAGTRPPPNAGRARRGEVARVRECQRVVRALCGRGRVRALFFAAAGAGGSPGAVLMFLFVLGCAAGRSGRGAVRVVRVFPGGMSTRGSASSAETGGAGRWARERSGSEESAAAEAALIPWGNSHGEAWHCSACANGAGCAVRECFVGGSARV